MIILGLHFGHDATAAVLRDGQVLSCVLRERHSRIKHAISLDASTIDQALAAAGMSSHDVDCIAITSTQGIELIIDDDRRLSIRLRRHAQAQGRSTLEEVFAREGIDPARLAGGSLRSTLEDPGQRNTAQFAMYRHFYPEHRTRRPDQTAATGWIDTYVADSQWRGMTLREIAAADFSALFSRDDLRLGFHLPVSVTLDGHELPGYFVSHHMAHAAAVFFGSEFEESAILTHDGYADGSSNLSGMLFWGQQNHVYPITPHHLVAASVYERIGMFLGLGEVGPAGKLMGLAAYGKPRFFDRDFVGNWYDLQRLHPGGDAFADWARHCLETAAAAGYDMSSFGGDRFHDASQVTSLLCVDIAASTQKVFEEASLAAVETMFKAFARAGRRTPNLCLSGGAALNCPANGRVFREGPFPNLFIEPGCDDSGVAVGAAQHIAHNVYNVARGNPRRESIGRQLSLPYLGVEFTEEQFVAALDSVAQQIVLTRPADLARAAAEDLAADRIIGWFEGRSEIGPRALGHRSILADPRQAENWARVNRLKGREAWRPFAPAVLASEARHWFRGTPLPSPYMLFTGTVCSDKLPAITHVDGSTRLQTVDESCGLFNQVLVNFFELTGIPVVLNTSFNGPGEPIVESPTDALRLFIHSTLDVLYIGGRRVIRRG